MSSWSGVQPEEPGRTTADASARGALDQDAAAVAAQGAELFKLAQLGDRGAFGRIVQLYQDRLYNAVLRLVGDFDEARDLTQEAFTRALEKIDSFRGDAQPYTWLFRIAMNLAISQLRTEQRRRTFTIGALESGANGQTGRESREDQASALLDRVAKDRHRDNATNDPASAIQQREQNEQVLAALGRISAEERAILIMRDVEGFDYQQMADVLNLPLGTLKSRLFRARVALRDELRPYIESGR